MAIWCHRSSDQLAVLSRLLAHRPASGCNTFPVWIPGTPFAVSSKRDF